MRNNETVNCRWFADNLGVSAQRTKVQSWSGGPNDPQLALRGSVLREYQIVARWVQPITPPTLTMDVSGRLNIVVKYVCNWKDKLQNTLYWADEERQRPRTIVRNAHRVEIGGISIFPLIEAWRTKEDRRIYHEELAKSGLRMTYLHPISDIVHPEAGKLVISQIPGTEMPVPCRCGKEWGLGPYCEAQGCHPIMWSPLGFESDDELELAPCD